MRTLSVAGVLLFSGALALAQDAGITSSLEARYTYPLMEGSGVRPAQAFSTPQSSSPVSAGALWSGAAPLPTPAAFRDSFQSTSSVPPLDASATAAPLATVEVASDVANVQAASSAVAEASHRLKLTSRVLRVIDFFIKNENLNRARQLIDTLRGTTDELGKRLDSVGDLVEVSGDETDGDSVADTAPGIVVSGKQQAKSLDRLARRVRDLETGPVASEKTAAFAVSDQSVATNYKAAERNTKRHLAILQSHAFYLENLSVRLDDASQVAGRAANLFAGLESRIESVLPRWPWFGRALMDIWYDADKLATSYRGLSTALREKSIAARDSAAIDRRRAANLRESGESVLGFNLSDSAEIAE